MAKVVLVVLESDCRLRVKVILVGVVPILGRVPGESPSVIPILVRIEIVLPVVALVVGIESPKRIPRAATSIVVPAIPVVRSILVLSLVAIVVVLILILSIRTFVERVVLTVVIPSCSSGISLSPRIHSVIAILLLVIPAASAVVALIFAAHKKGLASFWSIVLLLIVVEAKLGRPDVADCLIEVRSLVDLRGLLVLEILITCQAVSDQTAALKPCILSIELLLLVESGILLDLKSFG